MTPSSPRFQTPALDPVALLRALGLEGVRRSCCWTRPAGRRSSPAGTTSPGTPSFACARAAGVVSVTAGAGVAALPGRGPAPSRSRRARLTPSHPSRRCAAPRGWRRCRAGAGPRTSPRRRPCSACSLRRRALPRAPAGHHARRPRHPRHRRVPAGPAAALRPRHAARRCSSTGSPRTRAQAAAAAARVGEALARARRPAPAALHGNDLPVFRSNFTRAEYEEVVRRTREYVFAGDIFQANLVAAAGPLLRAAEPAPLRDAAHRQPLARSPAICTSATTS